MTSSLVSRFTIWDYLVFCGMLVVSSAIGVYCAFVGTKKVSTDEFLMGGRQLSAFPVALSILASFMSAITLLGTASEVYLAGTQYVIICVSYCFVIPATAYFYMPVFHHLQLTSAYEYLEIRFNKVIRSMGSMTFSLQMLIYMSIVLYAPALALSQVTGISTWTSVLSIGIVCTFYTSIGGMKAVVWTDVFQIGLMFGSMIMVVLRGTIDLGGLGYVFDRASEGGRLEFFNFNPNPTERHTVFGMTIGAYFTWMSVYGVSQAMVQRYLTIPTIQGARKAIWINLPGLSFLMLTCAMAGLVIYARYHDCDPIMTKKVSSPDQLLPLYVMDVLGKFTGIPGLFVSGIFSGALRTFSFVHSTVSSGVNSLAAVTLEDVVKCYIVEDMTDRFATTLTKFLGVGIVTSLIVTFWIGIGAFYYKPAHRMARRSVMGCLQEYINVTHQDPANVTFPIVPDPYVANPSTFAPQEAYDWDRMVELGRRKKAADHVESGAINAGYVDEGAYCSPSIERIKAPDVSTIGEATAPVSAVIPAAAVITFSTAESGGAIDELVPVPAQLDLPQSLRLVSSSPAPSEPFDVICSRSASPVPALAEVSSAPQGAQPQQVTIGQQPNAIEEVAATTSTDSAQQNSEAGGAAPAN
ncbi:hypothetical protein HPB49_013486 [Dermacentor silvarum]|uniref:Uncharacterized protein n=1 Tax=Dermacentor silvarum TaxID=543639 RepID=A0ACB8DD60_DERSI|nr:hypothetical protein HPB49_013486 [Dermacentor silvarum]